MKNILITGASSGLGLFLSKFFDDINCNLITIGRDKKKIKKLKNYLQNKNKKNCFSLDINIKKNLKKFLTKIKSNKFDAVIHCMGGGFGKNQIMISQKDLNFLFNINVAISAEINKQIVEKKLFNQNLKLIHVSSVAAIECTASVGYSMTKASLISYVKTLSKHLIKKNIFVHCILPGAFEYENNAFARLKLKNRKIYNEFIEKKLPRKEISKPGDFLGLFKLLISEEGNILTGSSITADYSESNSFRI
jgi:short-subunit dehydrogenase